MRCVLALGDDATAARRTPWSDAARACRARRRALTRSPARAARRALLAPLPALVPPTARPRRPHQHGAQVQPVEEGHCGDAMEVEEKAHAPPHAPQEEDAPALQVGGHVRRRWRRRRRRSLGRACATGQPLAGDCTCSNAGAPVAWWCRRPRQAALGAAGRSCAVSAPRRRAQVQRGDVWPRRRAGRARGDWHGAHGLRARGGLIIVRPHRPARALPSPCVPSGVPRRCIDMVQAGHSLTCRHVVRIVMSIGDVDAAGWTPALVESCGEMAISCEVPCGSADSPWSSMRRRPLKERQCSHQRWRLDFCVGSRW